MATAKLSDYELLKRFGHDPVKAAEILLDVKRGDKHATEWLRIARTFEERS